MPRKHVVMYQNFATFLKFTTNGDIFRIKYDKTCVDAKKLHHLYDA